MGIDLWKGRYWGIRLEWKLPDFWIGLYCQRDKCGPQKDQINVWVCFIPTLPLHVWWLTERKVTQ
jgi:hypothetical protein